MLPKRGSLRLGISFKVSIITVLLLFGILGGMLIIVSNRLNTDFHRVQIQGYRNQADAIKGLVSFQTEIVERMLRSHMFNPIYAESLNESEFSETDKLLRILNSNLQILNAALLVDN